MQLKSGNLDSPEAPDMKLSSDLRDRVVDMRDGPVRSFGDDVLVTIEVTVALGGANQYVSVTEAYERAVAVIKGAADLLSREERP